MGGSASTSALHAAPRVGHSRFRPLSFLPWKLPYRPFAVLRYPTSSTPRGPILAAPPLRVRLHSFRPFDSTAKLRRSGREPKLGGRRRPPDIAYPRRGKTNAGPTTTTAERRHMPRGYWVSIGFGAPPERPICRSPALAAGQLSN